MTVPINAQAYTPTFEDLVAIYLRTIKLGMFRRGLVANTLEGSEYWYRARALAGQIAPVFANNKLSVLAMDPLRAQGDDLINFAAVFGVKKRAAAAAVGLLVVSVTGTGTVAIPAAYQATASDGRKYQTTSASSVANGATVEVKATVGGIATNKPVGAGLTWDSATVGLLGRTSIVGGNGIVGGVDEDTVEVVRTRLINRLSAPGYGGNWSDVKTQAENASASISAAYVYPAIQGPGSYGIAIVRNTGDRTLASSVVSLASDTVAAYMPGSTRLNATTVTPDYLDVILSARLALPVIGGGAGGGWRDSTPWPNAASGAVKITSYGLSGGIYTATTDAVVLNGLAVGSRIGVWSFANQKMREYTVASVVLAGTYKLTVVGGFVEDCTNAYVSAGAERLVDYSATFAASFLALGPGEKSVDVNIVPRASRRPSTDVADPATCGSLLTSKVTAAFSEVQSLDYLKRYTTNTTTTQTDPTVSVLASDPPHILVLKQFAITKA